MPAENLFINKCTLPCERHIARKYRLRHGAGNAARKRGKPFGMAAQRFEIGSRLAVKALCERLGNDGVQVAVALRVPYEQRQMEIIRIEQPVLLLHGARRDIYLAPDDRLYALFAAAFIKIHRTVHNAVVGYRNRTLPCPYNGIRDIAHPAFAVQQAVFGVKVQMYETHC